MPANFPNGVRYTGCFPRAAETTVSLYANSRQNRAFAEKNTLESNVNQSGFGGQRVLCVVAALAPDES